MEMNKVIKSLQMNIANKLKNTQMSPQKIKDLLNMVYEICYFSQQYEEKQFKLKLQQLEDKLKQIDNDLISLIDQINKKKGFIRFFKNDDIQLNQQKVCKKIQELHYETKTFFEDCSLITVSSYTRIKQFIDMDFINIQTNIIINHPKFLPIKSKVELMLKQDPYADVFELGVLRRVLMSKIKEKAQQNLTDTQIRYLEKFDKKKNNTQVFIVSYARETKIMALSSEIYPFIITTNKEQNRIYLCKGMKLRFFPNQTLKVLETNSDNKIMEHFQGVTESDNKPSNQYVQIANYGYIKFQYLEIDTEMEKKQQTVNNDKNQQQKMPSKGSTFEFHLKNSRLSLEDTIPSISATLYHDTAGFYVLPIKTEFQNYYLLYYDNYLQTSTNKYNFGLQIKGKGWIQIITEKKSQISDQ